MTDDVFIKIKKTGTQTYAIALGGKLHSDNAEEIDNQICKLLKKDVQMIVLDMAELNYISSRGIGIVFELHAKIKKRNGSVLLCNLQPQIKKVFDIANALPPDAIFTSYKEADEYLDQMMKNELSKGNETDD